jgi:hypothetical protein
MERSFKKEVEALELGDGVAFRSQGSASADDRTMTRGEGGADALAMA